MNTVNSKTYLKIWLGKTGLVQIIVHRPLYSSQGMREKRKDCRLRNATRVFIATSMNESDLVQAIQALDGLRV